MDGEREHVLVMAGADEREYSLTMTGDSDTLTMSGSARHLTMEST